MSNHSDLEHLTYDWPPNLMQYESKIFLGLTTVEAIASSLGFLLPIALWQSLAGFMMGIVICLMVLLTIKKLDRFGGRPIPIYLFSRWLEARQQPELELPLIMGGSSGMVEVETWEGETIMVIEE